MSSLSHPFERVIGALLLALAGCGGSSSSDQVTRVCQPGDQKGCACPGGAQGAQVCRDDGSGWGACEGCGGAAGDASAGSGGADAGSGGATADASAGMGGAAAGAGGTGGQGAAAGGSDASDNNDSSAADDGGCQFPWADCDMNAGNGCETDLSAVDSCGECWHSCNLQVNDATEALCLAGDAGQFVCDYVACSLDYWDLDANRQNGCEYYCVKKADGDLTCDNIDENCDGVRDEGVDKCSDAANCGACGRNCARPHATGKCVAVPMQPCDVAHTSCVLDHCDDGWADANQSMMDGCETPVP